jgi:predicted amidohydrolase
MKTIKAASVQFTHSPGDKSHNLQIIETYVKQASGKQVDLIVFPEMCITGYWHVRKLSEQEVISLAENVPSGPSTQRLLSLAQKYHMTVGAGLIEIAEDGSLYNTYVAAMPDGNFASHRKLHCFISPFMTSGSTYTVFDTPHGVKMGILICYDNNIIENARITALMGAEVLLAPHQTGGCNSPSPRCMGTIDTELWDKRDLFFKELEAEFKGPKGREWLLRWLPSRAHDNGMFLIFSNGVGKDDDEVRTGNAMIIDPYGEIIAETWKPGNDMVISELDEQVISFCTGQRWLKSRRPELYKPLTEFTGRETDTRAVRFSYRDED